MRQLAWLFGSEADRLRAHKQRCSNPGEAPRGMRMIADPIHRHWIGGSCPSRHSSIGDLIDPLGGLAKQVRSFLRGEIMGDSLERIP